MLEALGADRRPTLMLWADSDPVIPLGDRASASPSASAASRRRSSQGASHFLQEDAGPEIGRRIADWLASG